MESLLATLNLLDAFSYTPPSTSEKPRLKQPLLPPPHQLPRRRLRLIHRIRRIQRRVIRRITRQHLRLHRRIALPILTRRRADRHIPRANHLLPRREINPLQRALEHLERRQRLVERHLMPALVNPHKRKLGRLPHLPVRNTVTRLDVNEASDVVVLGRDDIRDSLPAEPVAVVVGVAEVQRDADIPPQQRADVFDRVHAPIIVAGRPERRADGVVGFREVDVRADGLLHGGRVEVVDVEGIREGVGGQLAEVVFVAAGVDVVQVLDLLVAEVVGGAADLVEAGRVAGDGLVVAVA